MKSLTEIIKQVLSRLQQPWPQPRPEQPTADGRKTAVIDQEQKWLDAYLSDLLAEIGQK